MCAGHATALLPALSVMAVGTIAHAQEALEPVSATALFDLRRVAAELILSHASISSQTDIAVRGLASPPSAASEIPTDDADARGSPSVNLMLRLTRTMSTYGGGSK